MTLCTGLVITATNVRLSSSQTRTTSKLYVNWHGCGDTPLHQACRQDWLDVLKLLIEEYGGDPNVVTKSNESLLHYACLYGDTQIAEYLITKHHLNPLLRDVDQLEPLDYAINNHRIGVAVYLCQHCISSGEMLNPNRIKTTINLMEYTMSCMSVGQFYIFDPKWKTTNGDNILELVCSSKTCISHIPSAVMLKILNRYNSTAKYINPS